MNIIQLSKVFLTSLFILVSSNKSVFAEDVWSLDAETEILTHMPTETKFPPMFLDLIRGDHTTYSEDGSDVSVPYLSANKEQSLTIYLSFYGGTALVDYVEFGKTAIGQRLSLDPEIIKESIFFRPKRESYPIDYGAFQGKYSYPYENSGEEIGTELWIAQEDNFFLKIRYSYPMNMAEPAAEKLETILENSDFILNNHMLAIIASERLGIPFCQDIDVEGSPNVARIEPITLTMLIGVSVELISQYNTEKATLPKGCLYDLNVGSNNLKLVNKAFPEASANEANISFQPKMQLDLYFDDWELDSIFMVFESAFVGGLSELIGEEDGSTGPHYYLTREKDGKIELFDFFRGMPSLQIVKQSVAEIMSGKRPPQASVFRDEEGNIKTNLNISAGMFGNED